ncbi:hypothetical protein DFP72DRAFT_798276 [Ephemerocybe angulata]|uniref:Uncharacterized protein n=1 Tax=Ephemerocybe angulata TaxID=980116 RepID=A0A8H6IHR0_9AGAR|nr:hypothetical protein DFP72DRAFT_798276 [Tulosesus angulatus]
MEEELSQYLAGIKRSSSYFPYPNKTSMLLDIVDNLPRLRMSSNQLTMILWLLEECGVGDVPSYTGFRKLQEGLRKSVGFEPVKYTSSVGNVFYVNDVRNSVAQDFANPEVAAHLQLYPEITEGPVSEVWQAQRWKEYAPSQLTPMFAKSDRQKFYIGEVAQLRDGRLAIPQNWMMRDAKLCADCQIVTISEDRKWKVGVELEAVNSDEFSQTYLDIMHHIKSTGMDEIPWDTTALTGPISTMPNPLRDLAGDDDLFVVMLPLWCDDVSGNKSKQYNKHINIYMANSAIPGRLLQQEYFVRFVSTSPHATSPEQFAALKEQINATHTNPIRCFNAKTKRPCRVVLRVPGLPADNPQQSDEACHMGGNTLCKCRKCMVGGPSALTESDEGYHALFEPGNARSATMTRAQLERQLKLASYGVQKAVKEAQTETGIKDKVTERWIEILLERARAMKKSNPKRSHEDISRENLEWLHLQPGEKMNPLLDIDGLDPTQDTPVEILHTVLLGIVKYLWHHLHTTWSDAQRDLFTVRLQSTDISGLSSPPIRAVYMMQYRNNLIGKNFKTLMQTIAFHARDITTPKQFSLIKSVGELGALLWIPEIEDMEVYLEDLTIAIGNVLDAFSDIQPSKILQKMKIHILTHLPQDIRRFGPAIRYSTEVFECFNAIFRLCSVLSNHQAPSRDIARQFASMDRLKHLISGGFWKTDDGEWVQAGQSVLDVLKSDSTVQRHIGWVPPRPIQPGKCSFYFLYSESHHPDSDLFYRSHYSKRSPSTPCKTHDSSIPTTLLWRTGKSVTARSGDLCHEGSWVVSGKTGQRPIIGRICEIVSSGLQSLIYIEQFTLGHAKHPELGMPVLSLADEPHMLISPSAIEFEISVQHDCYTLSCQPTATRYEHQEREETTRTRALIQHVDDTHFVLNIHSVHNAHLLRRVLPRELYAPTPLYADRAAHHALLASELRITQSDKRARTKEKTRATRAANKKKADVRQNELDGAMGEPNEEDDPELAGEGESSDDSDVGNSDSGDEVEENSAQLAGPGHRKRKRIS